MLQKEKFDTYERVAIGNENRTDNSCIDKSRRGNE